MEVRGQVLPRRYEGRDPATAYLAGTANVPGDYGRFVLEILREADADTDFSRFDADGDGYVDALFINVLSTPPRFLLGEATGIFSLGFAGDFVTDDPAVGGGMVHIDPSRGSVQRARDFTESVGSMCHEYGHVLGLNDLYDIDFVPDADPASDAAGIGDWGLMGWGGDGWHGDDGPAGMSAYSRWMLGWARIVDVASQRENLRLPAVGLAGDLIAFLWPRANSSSSSTGRQARRTTTATCLAAAC